MKTVMIVVLCTITILFILNFQNKESETVLSEVFNPKLVITEETLDYPSEKNTETEIKSGAREIFPYSKALPEYPDFEKIINQFPDQNQNGVRDDIEIDLIEDFQDDAQLVEQFFSAARVAQKDLELARDNLLTPDSLAESMEMVGQVSACGNYYFNSFYKDESGWNWIDMYNLHIHSKTYNTDEKRRYLRALEKASHGMSGGFKEVDHKTCSDFLMKNKSLFNLN